MTRRWRRRDRRNAALAAGAFLLLAVLVHASARTTKPSSAAGPVAADAAIGWARAQLGAPYVWGGTGPYAAGFDCSGLVMQAWRSAGITLPRTSQQQWAAGHQVTAAQPGDLVFFAGADGTPAAPGHVGLVTDPAAHLMIDAYAAGFPVRYDTYGLPTSAAGLADPVGFTDPAAPGAS